MEHVSDIQSTIYDVETVDPLVMHGELTEGRRRVEAARSAVPVIVKHLTMIDPHS